MEEGYWFTFSWKTRDISIWQLKWRGERAWSTVEISNIWGGGGGGGGLWTGNRDESVLNRLSTPPLGRWWSLSRARKETAWFNKCCLPPDHKAESDGKTCNTETVVKGIRQNAQEVNCPPLSLPPRSPLSDNPVLYWHTPAPPHFPRRTGLIVFLPGSHLCKLSLQWSTRPLHSDNPSPVPAIIHTELRGCCLDHKY